MKKGPDESFHLAPDSLPKQVQVDLQRRIMLPGAGNKP